MQLHAGVFLRHSCKALYRGLEHILRALAYSGVGSLHAGLRIHVVFIRQKSCQISRIKRHRFFEIKRLDGFHQIIRHLLGAVLRHMIEGHMTGSLDAIVIVFRIVIPGIAPATCPLAFEAEIGLHFGVKEPERYVNSLDLFDMILILKQLRHHFFAAHMLGQSFLSLLLVELKWDNVIRFQHARNLALQDYGIAAVRAACRRGRLFADDLAAAGLTGENVHVILFSCIPFGTRLYIPVHVSLLLAVGSTCLCSKLSVLISRLSLISRLALRSVLRPGRIFWYTRRFLHRLKLRCIITAVTIRTLQLLTGRIKGQRPAAGRTFISYLI